MQPGNGSPGRLAVPEMPGPRTLKNFLSINSNLYMHRDFRETQSACAVSTQTSGFYHIWARSLVRSERPAHNRAVVGSNPSGPTGFSIRITASLSATVLTASFHAGIPETHIPERSAGEETYRKSYIQRRRITNIRP